MIAALLGSVGGGFANSVNGSFFCETVFWDGSGQDVYITTTERGMKIKLIKYGDESDYVEIHKGKKNDFRVFVLIKNLFENLVVLTATEDAHVFHYNGITTATGISGRDSASQRVVRGSCKKL